MDFAEKKQLLSYWVIKLLHNNKHYRQKPYCFNKLLLQFFNLKPTRLQNV